jgi:hypothetical protein
MKPTFRLSVQRTHINKTPRSRHPFPARPSRSKLRAQRWNLDLSRLGREFCWDRCDDGSSGIVIVVVMVGGLVPSLRPSVRLRSRMQLRSRLRLRLRSTPRLPSRPRSNLPLPPSFQRRRRSRRRRRIPVELLDLVYDHLFRLFLLFLFLGSAVFFGKVRSFGGGLQGLERLMFPIRSNLRLRVRLRL